MEELAVRLTPLLTMIASLVPIFGGWWIGKKVKAAIIKTWKDESDKGPPK